MTHSPASAPAGSLHLALLGALDNRLCGLLILDAESCVVHATARARELLGFDPGVDVRNSNLPEVFCRFSFDSVPLAHAFAVPTDDAPAILLRGIDQQGSLLLRVRDLGFGYRAVDLEPAHTPAPDHADADPVAVALADHVTGLVSRSCFEKAAKAALGRHDAGSAAVLLLDLDRFKAVNDTMGHAAGDALLRLVAERLQVAVRHGDIVCRFGGDEFAILLKTVDGSEHAAAVAARILDLVQRSYLIDGRLANVGVSVGIALAPEHGTDSASLIHAADLALYEAKASGRAVFRFYDSDLKRRALARREGELDLRRREGEIELRRALALRQLVLFYQPQTTIGGRLVGFEALLRWQHPIRGLVPHADFRALAERIGAIVPIGDWILRTGAIEAMKWPEPLTIAVKVSPLQLDSTNFAERVERILTATGLTGRRLEIEITEDMLISGGDKAVGVLNDLRGLGVRVVMDDFGTGYASLSQLTRFPFAKIKIGRSLTRADGEDVKKRAIVRAIATLGRSLGICTLAEGVEADPQIESLESDGSDSVQGYLLGKPVAESDLGELITRLQVKEPAPPIPSEADPAGDDSYGGGAFPGPEASRPDGVRIP